MFYNHQPFVLWICKVQASLSSFHFSFFWKQMISSTLFMEIDICCYEIQNLLEPVLLHTIFLEEHIGLYQSKCQIVTQRASSLL